MSNIDLDPTKEGIWLRLLTDGDKAFSCMSLIGSDPLVQYAFAVDCEPPTIEAGKKRAELSFEVPPREWKDATKETPPNGLAQEGVLWAWAREPDPTS